MVTVHVGCRDFSKQKYNSHAIQCTHLKYTAQWFLVFSQSRAVTTVNFRAFHHLQKKPCNSPVITLPVPLSLPNPNQPLTYYLSEQIAQSLHMNKIISYVVPWEWFLLLHTMFSGFTGCWDLDGFLPLPQWVTGYHILSLSGSLPQISSSSLWAFFWHCKPHCQYSYLETFSETVKCYILSLPWELQGKLQTRPLLGFPGAWARRSLLIHFTKSTSLVKYSCISCFLPLLLLQELSISSAWLDSAEGLDL